ncbi:glycosyltransferase [Bandra megavirus]|uniref:Glycosyltransferase n=2 Tax=unclassified Megavirus TaxID=3068396 RepID=A0A2K9V8C5_9VIRU|nr:glycosyltransferase [Bandra megavirus]
MTSKIIHQIWIQGYSSIPDNLKKYHLECQKVNNNFEQKFWDENKIVKLIHDKFDQEYLDLYNSYTFPAQKADFARYIILYTYGGIYLDMDMVCKKNLEPFLQYNFFFTPYIFYNFFKRYLNGVIGAKPKHPVFLNIFKNMFERRNILHDVTNSTGTGLFYHSVMEYANNNPNNDMVMIDRKYLHPCDIYNSDDCTNTCTDCFIVHQSYSSWSPSLRILKSALKHKYWILIIIILIIVLLVIRKLI